MPPDPYDYNRNPQGSFSVTIGDFISRTYLWMVLGLMLTFGTALVCWMTGLVQVIYNFHFVILIATLVMSFSMSSRIERMSVASAVTCFVSFSVLFGLTMSIYLALFGLTSVLIAFFATALFFGVLSLYGRLTHADLSGVGSILFSGLIFLLVFSLLSLFIPGMRSLDRLACIIGIATFLGYTAYDSQRMCDLYYYYSGYPDMLEKASIFSALQLYLNFLNLFIYLLRFMGNRNRD